MIYLLLFILAVIYEGLLVLCIKCIEKNRPVCAGLTAAAATFVGLVGVYFSVRDPWAIAVNVVGCGLGTGLVVWWQRGEK